MTTKTAAAPLVIGVTSHRNLAPGEVEPIRERVRALFELLRRDFPHMPLIVLSSLAEGGDQLVAEEALAANVRVIAALPMARGLYDHDFTERDALTRFNALCDAAEVVVVPQIAGRTETADTASPDGEARDRHYAQAGVYVSDHCHILLAIWDGKPLSLLGGTAQIAHYHLSGVKPSPGEMRRSERHNLLGYGSERLVYHIVCSRDQPDGSPAPPLRPLETRWRTGNRAAPGDGPLPDAFQSLSHAPTSSTSTPTSTRHRWTSIRAQRPMTLRAAESRRSIACSAAPTGWRSISSGASRSRCGSCTRWRR